MLLDIDLIKAILLDIEESEHWPDFIAVGPLEGYDNKKSLYHLFLLDEAGLVKGKDISTLDAGRNYAVERLTWEGHTFLTNAKNPSNWSKLKTALGTIGDVSFEAAKAGLAGMAHAAVATAIQRLS